MKRRTDGPYLPQLLRKEEEKENRASAATLEAAMSEMLGRLRVNEELRVRLGPLASGASRGVTGLASPKLDLRGGNVVWSADELREREREGERERERERKRERERESETQRERE